MHKIFRTTFFLVTALILFSAIFTSAAEIEITGQQGSLPDRGLAAATTASGYLDNLYIWMLGIVGLSSLFALVYGGVLYIFSGAIESTSEAKRWIKNALWGLLLAATSWLILNTINPELVKKINIESIIQRYTPPQ